MSLKKYFFFAFGSIFVASVLMGFTTIFTANSLQVENERAVYSQQQLRLLKSIKSSSSLMLKEVADFIILKNNFELDEFNTAKNNLKEDLQKLKTATQDEIEHISTHNDAKLISERKEIDTVNKIYKISYNIIRESENIVKAIQTNTFNKSLVLFKESIHSAYDNELRAIIDNQIQDEQKEMDETHDLLRITFKNFQTIAIILLTLLVCTILFASIITFSSILNPINNLVRAVTKIGHGDYTAEINKSEGEIGILADSLKTMAQDLAETQAQLVQSAKMASIGQMAAGITQEIHHPLTVIKNNLYMMRREITVLETDYGLNESIKTIEQNTQRISEVIDHLGQFSRQSDTLKHPLNVNDVINSSYSLLTHQFESLNINFDTEFHTQLPSIMGNNRELEQVFINILTNARDALYYRTDPSQNKINVTTEFKKETTMVRILFSDNGSGILKKDVPRVFDPFFTTKGLDTGTGLGLSMAYGIIKNHGGTISVAKTSSEGTTFEILLPTASAQI
ncbi:ATP-binding protein [Maridesulfovibrio sp.]|uniref:sensor histidine kinase n=1 Tax=Maridesulfovibrio sp. TaxID=2795000 RepID=UPI002A187DD7|nr:ATP-binding protein [Maridesulfovibrio sp.]